MAPHATNTHTHCPTPPITQTRRAYVMDGEVKAAARRRRRRRAAAAAAVVEVVGGLGGQFFTHNFGNLSAARLCTFIHTQQKDRTYAQVECTNSTLFAAFSRMYFCPNLPSGAALLGLPAWKIRVSFQAALSVSVHRVANQLRPSRPTIPSHAAPPRHTLIFLLLSGAVPLPLVLGLARLSTFAYPNLAPATSPQTLVTLN